MNLRISPELKRQVVEYAERSGLNINAAAIVLLQTGVRIEGRKR